MIYKIALASSDGASIDSHFGAAERFYIAELDTETEDCEITGFRDVNRACHGGYHEIDAFAAILDTLSDVSAIVAQRVGPGARKYISEHGIAVYQIALGTEQAICLLIEEKQWEVDKWLSHTKN
ncbi:Predicted Fe-Mo cluster-binding protein, NifX family [Ruminococcus sp. YE71]|uniref:NifB/NifX family molybdenum-iron cluster-binding protein n=1 Tax=unclassified Ruminococcus TaxID=2608920 RepID=UPI0008818414|nr:MULTISPECIES: NifB/NifX family molybdenum-iron cluster-binding protein [unclassified Ruminococcus]SDA30580.1 Predicted Fe-Mo cluster-binding protein, NifX family [Ruminococcus sp. YE78]SFW50183.1 Predicted Fe-Mo cluster-binding protein, NifX family [Ruminococcus sp. YE71]